MGFRFYVITTIQLPLVEFCCSVKEEYPKLAEKAKIFFPIPFSPNLTMCDSGFCSFSNKNNTSQQIENRNRHDTTAVF